MKEQNYSRTTDKGWNAMQDLLDREMPTPAKRRRILWWWVVLLLLPLTALVMWYRGSDHFVDPAQPGSVPSTSTTMALQSDRVGPKEQSPEQKSNTTSKSAGHPFENKHLPASKAVARDGRSAPEIVFRDTLLKPVILQKDVTANVLPPMPLPDVPTNPFEGQPAPKDVITLNTLKKSISGLDFLPVPTHPIETTKTTLAKPLYVISLPNSEKTLARSGKASTWLVGASAYVSTELFRTVNGFGGGLAVHWQPTNRWGIRSGIQYAQNAPTAAYQPVAVVQPNQYEQAVDSFFIIEDIITGNIITPANGSSSIQETVYIPVAKLKLVELPILISYKVVRQLKLFAGLNTAYLLATNTASQSYSGDLKLKANSSYAIQQLNTLATSDIQHWRFDAQTGIGVALGQRIEMALFAKLPIRAAATIQTVQQDNTGPTSSPTGESLPGNKLNRRIPAFSLSATYFFGRSK